MSGPCGAGEASAGSDPGYCEGLHHPFYILGLGLLQGLRPVALSPVCLLAGSQLSWDQAAASW